MQTTEEIAGKFVDLLQNFIRIRPSLIVPEHVAEFKQKIEALRNNGTGVPQDRIFLPRIFVILAHRDNPPTMGELSAELDIPVSSTTRIVDWLVGAEFVERCPDEHDRRIVRVCMTENARKFIQVGIAYIKQRIVSLLNNFSPEEQIELLRLMNKLFSSLQAEK